jgi:hypothetical protein
VVGLSRVGGLTATLWDDGRVWNLNDLAVGYDGHLFHANDVNAAGAITGVAINAEGQAVAIAPGRFGQAANTSTGEQNAHGLV